MSMIYQWRPGFSWKVDPQVAGQRFADLVEEADGTLTASMIVDDARPATSPLHNDFEWDDSVAANEWREHTARMMIASVVVVNVREPEPGEKRVMPVRAFVNVRQEDRRGYTTTARVVTDKELFKQLVDDILGSINSYRMKLAAFKEYSQIAHLFDEFDEGLKKIK